MTYDLLRWSQGERASRQLGRSAAAHRRRAVAVDMLNDELAQLRRHEVLTVQPGETVLEWRSNDTQLALVRQS